MGNALTDLNLYDDKEDAPATKSNPQKEPSSSFKPYKEPPELPAVREYTREEVQQHNDEQNDFWIAVNTGSYYGVYDITAMAREFSLHPGPPCKFKQGFLEAKRNHNNGNDVSGIMGAGKPASHCWYKWPDETE